MGHIALTRWPRGYAIHHRECTQYAFPSTNCLLFLERRARVRSLVAAARAEKESRNDNNSRARAASSQPPLMSGPFSRSGFMKYPRHSFAPDSLLRPCRAPFMRAAVRAEQWSALCDHAALIARVRIIHTRVHVPTDTRRSFLSRWLCRKRLTYQFFIGTIVYSGANLRKILRGNETSISNEPFFLIALILPRGGEWKYVGYKYKGNI